MLKNGKALLPIAAMLILSACTRSAEQKALEDAPLTVGPAAKDVALTLVPPATGQLRKHLELHGAYSTADYFRAAEVLQEIAREDNNESLSRYAKGMVAAFYEDRGNFTQAPFAKSLYIAAMVGEAEPVVKEQLVVVGKQIQDARSKLTIALERSVTEYPWPKEAAGFDELLVAADKYLNWLLAKIPTLGLEESLIRPTAGAIREEYAKFRPMVEKLANKIHDSTRIPEAVDGLESAFATLDVAPTDAQKNQLRDARQLGAMVDGVEDALDALRLIVKVWRMVPEADRESAFKPTAPELYDFLNGKSEASLDCLTAPVCINPVLEAARVFGILPKLREYGPKKIAGEIEQAVLKFLKRAVVVAALEWLPGAPIAVRDRMNKEIANYQALIATVQKDTLGYARKNAESWAKTELNQQIPGVEAANVNVTAQDGRYKVSAEKPVAGAVATGAETLGVTLSVTNKFLPSDKQKLRAVLVGSMVKLLAMGGFRMPGGESYASYSIAMDGDRGKFHNLKTVLGDAASFAVPDSFLVKPDLTMERGKTEATSSITAQAELLRGISAQIKMLRDWEPNEFDHALAGVQVEDMAPEIPKGAVNESVFPKRLLFALAIGNSAIQLQNVTKLLSPAFLMLPEGKFLWGHQYREIGEGKISAVAGLVNIDRGNRGTVVKTADIARYILALDAFLDATEGIEATKSEPLLEKGADGTSVLEQIVEARRYLRLFMMGLTNFLVYVAQDKDGGFQSFHVLKEGKGVERAPSARMLLDQALAIRALGVSAKRLNMGLYSWAALDGYYFLNRVFWDQKFQFYAAKVGAKTDTKYGQPGLLEIAATIRAVREIEPYMPAGSQAQWAKIERPWTKALDAL